MPWLRNFPPSGVAPTDTPFSWGTSGGETHPLKSTQTLILFASFLSFTASSSGHRCQVQGAFCTIRMGPGQVTCTADWEAGTGPGQLGLDHPVQLQLRLSAFSRC